VIYLFLDISYTMFDVLLRYSTVMPLPTTTHTETHEALALPSRFTNLRVGSRPGNGFLKI
jgi:hypothetical protein